MSKIFARILSPLGVVIVVCFFLPWLTVSCGTVPVIDEASGMELANPFVIAGERYDGAGELYLVLAGGILVALAGLAFWVKRSALASTVCLLCGLAVVVFPLLLYQRMQAGLSEDEFAGGFINVVWEGGFWGSIIAGALTVVAALVSYGYPPGRAER